MHEQAAVKQVNLSHYMLPDDIDQQLTQLKQQLNDGERESAACSRMHCRPYAVVVYVSMKECL